MTLPASGNSISIGQLRTEFGGSCCSLAGYYRAPLPAASGALVPNIPANASIPAVGSTTISLGNFFAAQAGGCLCSNCTSRSLSAAYNTSCSFTTTLGNIVQTPFPCSGPMQLCRVQVFLPSGMSGTYNGASIGSGTTTCTYTGNTLAVSGTCNITLSLRSTTAGTNSGYFIACGCNSTNCSITSNFSISVAPAPTAPPPTAPPAPSVTGASSSWGGSSILIRNSSAGQAFDQIYVTFNVAVYANGGATVQYNDGTTGWVNDPLGSTTVTGFGTSTLTFGNIYFYSGFATRIRIAVNGVRNASGVAGPATAVSYGVTFV